ncbi:hypothetical protein B0293_33035 [Amycolatopsis azurea DSM 43854]|uniref:Uncharacterized protein n=1 Tax=Amycolatopsis azurea DSM 43854 TaxID=1238180 RepID=A0ABX3J3R7_9PSEU|nr:hypothetical protein B0293_33035 [Amycolatopsis azurea DSM 43854]
MRGKSKVACSVARPHTDLGCCESHFRNVEGCESGFRNADRHRTPVREGLLEGLWVPQGGLHGLGT